MTSRRVRLSAAGACLVAAAATGCSSSDGEVTADAGQHTAKPSASAAGTPSPSPTPDVRAQLRQAYADFVRAELAAFAANDVNSKALSDTTTSPLLPHLIDTMAQNRLQGLVTRGTLVTESEVTSIAADGKSAQLTSCDDTRGWRFYDLKKKALRPRPKTGHRNTITMKLVGDRWKVSLATRTNVTSC